MTSAKYRVFLIPLVTVLIMASSVLAMLLFGYRTIEEVQEVFSHRIWIALLNAILTVAIFYFVVKWFNKKFDWNKNWALRFVLDAGLVIVHSYIGMTFIDLLFEFGLFGHDPKSASKEFLYIIPIAMDTLFLVLIELIMGMEEKDKLAIKIACLEKEQINTKYSALKEQLDHHFLFNNLSVLSSLIYEDVNKADHFIQDFASTYRYVLQINQRNLVSVEEELDFINNYLHLYKFRFEEGFEYKVNVKKKLDCQIPPLTLQLLVENAIKHNMVSRKHPLTFSIEAGDQCLIVKNTIQPKKEKEISTKKGQENLIEKYRLLGNRLPEFREETNEYIVIVPLLKKQDD